MNDLFEAGGGGRPRRSRKLTIEVPGLQKRERRLGGASLTLAQEAEVVENVWGRLGMLGRAFDEDGGGLELIKLEMRTADQEVELLVFEWAFGKAQQKLSRRGPIALLQERVHLEYRRVGDFVCRLGAFESLIENADRLSEAPEWVNQQLRSVEHRLEITLVEVDRLTVVFERHLEVPVGRVDVADEIVSIWRVSIDLERLFGRGHGADQVASRNELPPSVQMGAQAIHEAFVLLSHFAAVGKLTWRVWDVKRKRALSCQRMVRILTPLAITAICACVSKPLPVGQTISVGTSDEGYLHQAVPLPDRGEGYERLRPREETRYGTATLIEAIERVAKAVAEVFPGGYPLRVGDLSNRRGGAHERHRSHRSGRDADLLFYARDAGGMAVRSGGWMQFDRYGLAMRRDRVFSFDEARNWHLVRTLVMESKARVKWVFCSNDIKARLLRYAARHEPSPRAVFRATWVLHQPGRGDPHADHFHVRVGCGPAERALGCREQAPFWPWHGDTASKDEDSARAAASDPQLLGWLFAEEHPNQGRHVFRRSFGIAPQPATIARRDID